MNRVLLEQLRQHTQDKHHLLDSHPLLEMLTNPNISQDQYRHALQALYAPHKQLELSLVVPLNLHFPDYHYQLRYPDIEKDLSQLQVDYADIAIQGLPISSPSEVVGLLYVLEGSRLGARHILCRLTGTQLPQEYFSGALNESASGWKGFTELTKEETLEYDQVVLSAQQGFDCFIHSLALMSKNRIQGMNYAQST